PPRRSQHVLRERRPPAGRKVPPPDLRKRRLGHTAGVNRKGAARMEAAALGKIERARHYALDRHPAVLLPMQLWDRAEQPDGVGMLRVGEERRDLSTLDDFAGINHDDLLRELGDDAEIVGDQHDGGAGLVAQIAHEIKDLRLNRDIEGGRRLIGDKQLWIAGQRHRDHDALAHATRELVRIVLEALLGRRDAYKAQHLNRPLARLLRRHWAVPQDDLDDLIPDREGWVERGHWLLEDHRDLVATQLAKLRCR